MTREEKTERIFERMPGAPADSDVSWLDNSVYPVLSRDGSMLVFSDQSSGTSSWSKGGVLRARFADGRFAAIGEGVPKAISPDGRWIMTRYGVRDGFTLYPIGAGAARTIRPPGLERFVPVAFYPDGASLLGSASVTGGRRCFRVPLNGAPAVPVTPVTIFGPAALSPDGRRVFCGQRVYEGPADTGRAIPGLEAPRSDEISRVVWSADGRALYAQVGGFIIRRIGVDDGSNAIAVDLTPARGSTVTQIFGFAFADDPRRYAYTRLEYRSTLYWARSDR